MSTRMVGNLRRTVVAYAGQITKLAKSLAPVHLRDGISSHVEENTDGEYIIRTTAVGADARAWEYGSGIHARRGFKHKYTIKPRMGKFLAFHWEVANANPERFSFLEDGRVLLTSVQHPGIVAANEGKGYIAPAQAEIRKRLKEQIGKDLRDAILGDLRESFRKK